MRVSVAIVLFLLFFNAGGTMLEETGVASTSKINDPDTGNNGRLTDAQEEARNVDPGQGQGGTLFGMYNSLAGTLEPIFNSIFPGAAMLKANGFPDFWINFLFTGMSVIVGLDTLAYFRGWDLV